ncbi:hypothetical protein ESCO_005952 [Escovopsis weberi]|uniref:Uncharacterized protein n=1 Tax=Escovopsis weberi TaxID=150374 RepID=A0A0M8MQ57_ESCWE|nr:hypothetical protein ESCO_005952 [Escovopsis weberi]
MLPRSSLLRSAVRPALSSNHHVLSRQTRTVFGRDSLGGPGGQEPRPPSPGGPEALRRNWIFIGGAFLALGIGYNWIARHPDEARQARDQSLSEMSGRKKTDMGGFRHD